MTSLETMLLAIIGLIIIFGIIDYFKSKKSDPIYNIAEITVCSINSEELAIDLVKSLALFGYDTTTKHMVAINIDMGWEVYGRKRFIINPETWQTPPTLTTPDLMKIFNDSLGTLRDLGSVVIQIDQGAGAIDIRIKKE